MRNYFRKESWYLTFRSRKKNQQRELKYKITFLNRHWLERVAGGLIFSLLHISVITFYSMRACMIGVMARAPREREQWDNAQGGEGRTMGQIAMAPYKGECQGEWRRLHPQTLRTCLWVRSGLMRYFPTLMDLALIFIQSLQRTLSQEWDLAKLGTAQGTEEASYIGRA